MFLLLWTLSASIAAPGELDASFDGDGVATFATASNDVATRLVVDCDGRMVIVGYSDDDLALWAVLPDGTLDPSFGSGGITKTLILGQTRGMDIATDADGRYVVTGFAQPYPDRQFFTARFTADGELDPTFNGIGYRTDSFDNERDEAHAVAIQDDGAILVGGWARNTAWANQHAIVMRILPDGTVDPDYGDGGHRLITFNGSSTHRLHDLVLQPDGHALAVGYYLELASNDSYNSAVARLTPGGDLDPTWNDDGVGIYTFCGNEFQRAERPFGAKLTATGELVMAGGSRCLVSSEYSRMAFRVDGSGEFDLGFGSSGVAYVPGDRIAEYNDIVLQDDGHAIAVGFQDSGAAISVTRFDTSGVPDPTFASGTVTLDLSGGDDVARGAALDTDGRLIMVGNSDGNLFVAKMQTDASAPVCDNGGGEPPTGDPVPLPPWFVLMLGGGLAAGGMRSIQES